MNIRNIAFIGILSIFASCQKDSGYSISGTVENPRAKQRIFVSELSENSNQTTIIDTLEVVDGKFETDLPDKERPTLSFLTLEGTRGNVLYVADNTSIEFQIYPDSLYASKVTGGEDNELLYSYFDKVRESNEIAARDRGEMMEAFQRQDTATLNNLQQSQRDRAEEDLETKRQLVRENPNSIVSVLVLQDMVNSGMVNSTEAKELYNNLSSDVKNSHLGQMLNQTITSMSLVEVGSKAPNFSGPTPNGEELVLNDVLGKVTLVDFWASWCKPCRDENPNIVRVYEKYHDEGLNIVGVSLDRPGQKERWEEAIAQDNLEWNHVSNLMYWDDPIAKKYGIRAIPAAFLLDENGVIVAKDLRGEDLENKVAELLNAN